MADFDYSNEEVLAGLNVAQAQNQDMILLLTAVLGEESQEAGDALHRIVERGPIACGSVILSMAQMLVMLVPKAKYKKALRDMGVAIASLSPDDIIAVAEKIRRGEFPS